MRPAAAIAPARLAALADTAGQLRRSTRWTSATRRPAGTSTGAAIRSCPRVPANVEPDGSWEVATRLIRGYEFADPSLVRAYYDHDRPLEGREMLLELRALNLFRVHVGVRVVKVYDEIRTEGERRAHVFGWAYRTLEGHVEAGQMDWQVWKWLDSGEVQFRVHAVSRTAHIRNPFVRLGFWLLRDHEREVFLDSTDRRMVRADPDRAGARGPRRAPAGGQPPADGPPPALRRSGPRAARPPRRRGVTDNVGGMSLLSTAKMYLRRSSKLDQPTDLYDHRVTLLDGGELDLASLRGHPTLIVNTASKCGYTPAVRGAAEAL